MAEPASTSFFSAARSQKARARRLRSRVVHKFWDYIDDFEDWRCLDSWVFDLIEDKGAILVVSELCDHGNLWDAVLAAGKIDHTSWLVCEVLVPLMVVLHHMHDSGIMHRNVNPSAVLFHSSGSACIGAFNLAERASDVNCSELESPVDFVAPEILLCCAYDNPIAHEDSEGHLPFMGTGENTDALFDSILFAEPVIPPEMDPLAADFIKLCLKKQPSERPGIKQLLAHEFITRHINWTAAPYERLPDEQYVMPRSPRTPLQKTIWQRITAKFAASGSGFPLALINSAPVLGTTSKGNRFAQSPTRRILEQAPSPPGDISSATPSQRKGVLAKSTKEAQEDQDPIASGIISALQRADSEGNSQSQNTEDPAHPSLEVARSRGNLDIRSAVRLNDDVEQKIVSQYDLSAMRALDENIVSQLDLSEEATAVAMKRLSGLLTMAPPEDGAGVDGSGYSGGSGTVKSLVNWTHTSHAQQGVEEGDRVAPQEDSLAGLLEGIDVVDEELAAMDANSAAAPPNRWAPGQIRRR